MNDPIFWVNLASFLVVMLAWLRSKSWAEEVSIIISYVMLGLAAHKAIDLLLIALHYRDNQSFDWAVNLSFIIEMLVLSAFTAIIFGYQRFVLFIIRFTSFTDRRTKMLYQKEPTEQEALARQLAGAIINDLEGEVTLVRKSFDIDVEVQGMPYKVKVTVQEGKPAEARRW